MNGSKVIAVKLHFGHFTVDFNNPANKSVHIELFLFKYISCHLLCKNSRTFCDDDSYLSKSGISIYFFF